MCIDISKIVDGRKEDLFDEDFDVDLIKSIFFDNIF